MSRAVKQLMYLVFKLFWITARSIQSFRIRSKATLGIMYPKYPVLDRIQKKRIHLRWGLFVSIIRFGILVKKRNICFRSKIPDLDFSKETHRRRILPFSALTSPSSLLELPNDVSAAWHLSTFSELLCYFLTVSFKCVPGFSSDCCPIPVSYDCSANVMGTAVLFLPVKVSTLTDTLAVKSRMGLL